MPKLTIRQWPLALRSKGETILETALSEGVPYPHGCRTGECGSCKSRLLSGEVTMTAYDEAVLDATERSQGLILACRAHPRGDVQVAWLGEETAAALPLQRITAQVTNIEAVTPHIRRIYAWPERPLKFAAGQYVRVGFGAVPPRSYSMANRPDEEVLEFHIRLVPDGAVSHYVATRLQVGEVIRIEGPFGDAHLRPDHDGPIFAIAGGSGLAPIKSIIRTKLHMGTRQPIRLFFGARDEADVYDEAEFLALATDHANFSMQVALSAPASSTRRLIGPLQDVVAATLQGMSNARCYIAGPPAMVEAVTVMAGNLGLPPDQVHADAFHGSGEPLPSGGRWRDLWSRFRRAGPRRSGAMRPA